MPQLRLALAQVNPRLGDLDGNVELVVAAAHEAAQAGAHLLVLPEMVLNGYPVEDLAYRLSFIDGTRAHVPALATRLADEGLGDLVVVVGHLDTAKDHIDTERLGVPKNAPTNSASVITGGRVVTRYDKHHLPNYGVFDEFRHFVPGDETQVVQVHGVDVAIAICEDIWQDGPSAAADAAEAGLLVVLNGSPYEAAKDDTRLELCARRAREGSCALAYVNLVGGQDELVFDGCSFVLNGDGRAAHRLTDWEAEERVTRWTKEADGWICSPGAIAEWDAHPADIYDAMVLSLRDYVERNRFPGVVLGLSGGIDSAICAAIAAVDCSIRSAHLSTYGDEARDVFYVVDADGEPLDEAATRRLHEAVDAALV